MELPLFPLNTVLFPGGVLPIHVFEERYKLMIRECIDKDATFGVVLIRSGDEVGEPAESFQVGTTARIAHVQHLEEGRMNLIAVGNQRFRIVRIRRQEPYSVAEVELLCSTDEEDAADLADTAGALFAEYYRLNLALSDQWTRSIGMPRDAATLADFVASRLAVSLWQKQRLLEALSVRQRLKLETDILGEAIRELTSRVTAARAQKWHRLAALN